jgi:hypothetical protein
MNTNLKFSSITALLISLYAAYTDWKTLSIYEVAKNFAENIVPLFVFAVIVFAVAKLLYDDSVAAENLIREEEAAKKRAAEVKEQILTELKKLNSCDMQIQSVRAGMGVMNEAWAHEREAKE